METCLIGLDVGTTGCKAIVFSPQGKVLGQGFHEYGMDCSAPGMAEQDAEKVWDLSLLVLKQAVAAAGVKHVQALSVSVQGDAIIPVDSSNRALHPAILGMDYRAGTQARWCEENLGGYEVFQATGMRPHPMNSAVKALWLRDNAPFVFKSAERIVTYADFILAKLGGEPLIDYSMASRTMVFDLATRQWSAELLGKMGMPANLFSKAAPSGTIAGKLSATVGSELRIEPGTQLVTGGHDQACAALGSGVIREGLGLISTGTAEVLSTTFNRPALSRGMYESFYPCYLHAREGLFFTFALLHIGGILLKWYRDTFAHAEVSEAAEKRMSAYALIDARMPARPSPLLVLPYWNGSGTPHCDLSAKGAILGWTLSSTRHDLAKAVLEGVTFELLLNLETMLKCGIAIDHLVAAGGGSRSAVWLQLKADILGRPVRTLSCPEAACLGAALLAGTATGIYASMEEAVKATVSTNREYLPRPDVAARYRERYSVYEKIYPGLRDLNSML